MKGGKDDPKPHHISITPKSAIAILPPKKVYHMLRPVFVLITQGADSVLVSLRSSRPCTTMNQNPRTMRSLPSIKATSFMLSVGKTINNGMRRVIRLSPMPEA